MAYNVRILKDSVGPNGIRLVTSELTYPRFVHAEFMTHRMFSRNSASSRAIPVASLMERILKDPVLPVWWGKNQSGMQAVEELDAEAKQKAQEQWLIARDQMVIAVEALSKGLSLHKQIANRLLEPWMWITVICTATEYENFFALRRHKDAQPEIKVLADLWEEALLSSTPTLLGPGEWHLPLVEDYNDLCDDGFDLEDIKRISVGRCARVSYLTHAGKRDPKADVDLCLKLLGNGHMSPFEHVAQALTAGEFQFSGNFRGWIQYRKTLPNEAIFQRE